MEISHQSTITRETWIRSRFVHLCRPLYLRVFGSSGTINKEVTAICVEKKNWEEESGRHAGWMRNLKQFFKSINEVNSGLDPTEGRVKLVN